MREVASNPVDEASPLAFNLVRVPFFLEPDYPTSPEFEETNRVRLIRKWGGEAGWKAQKNRHNLKGRGQEVGIEHFNLDRVASNTLASHRVVQWVTRTLGTNAAERLYADLNKRHFVQGMKLNNREMLAEAASGVGADADKAREVVDSGMGTEEIWAAQERLRALGVSGIPTLILGGQWQMPSGGNAPATTAATAIPLCQLRARRLACCTGLSDARSIHCRGVCVARCDMNSAGRARARRRLPKDRGDGRRARGHVRGGPAHPARGARGDARPRGGGGLGGERTRGGRLGLAAWRLTCGRV